MASVGLIGTRTGIVSMRVIFMRCQLLFVSIYPRQKMFDECRDFANDAVEKAFAFFGRGQIRVTDDAALGDFVEFVDEEYRTADLHIGDTVGVSMGGAVSDGSFEMDAIGVKGEH